MNLPPCFTIFSTTSSISVSKLLIISKNSSLYLEAISANFLASSTSSLLNTSTTLSLDLFINSAYSLLGTLVSASTALSPDFLIA